MCCLGDMSLHDFSLVLPLHCSNLTQLLSFCMHAMLSDRILSDCRTAFDSQLYEYDYWIDSAWVEGKIPEDLEGTYFRNGPGIRLDSPSCLRHPFDGDGMVFRLAFKDGRAHFCNRFVCVSLVLQVWIHARSGRIHNWNGSSPFPAA